MLWNLWFTYDKIGEEFAEFQKVERDIVKVPRGQHVDQLSED